MIAEIDKLYLRICRYLWKYKLEVDEIAMQVEELSAKTGGIPYTDILKEVADCLEL